MRIHARLQQDEVRPEIVQRSGQRALEDVQIDRVIRQVGQRDIQGGARLSGGEVFFRVQGQGEYIAAPRRQRGGTVPLVDVQVEDQDALCIAFLDQPVRGDREVVENAVPGSGIRKSVVAAAGAVGGLAMA